VDSLARFHGCGRKRLFSAKNRAPSIRVLVIDSDSMGGQLMASALKRSRDHFEVAGPATGLNDAIHILGAHKPHVTVLSADPQSSAEPAWTVLNKLRQSSPRTAVVVLMRTLERDGVIQAFRAGARGVISRSDSFKSLAKCIRSVHLGQVWASTREINFLLEALGQLRTLRIPGGGDIPQLTKRERQVTQLVADGMTNRDIAELLHLTEHTVSNYLYRIFDKLGVSNRVQLILYALSRNRDSEPRDADSPGPNLGRKAANA
jgi:DNA-binding NarL/FixJ family response regulator